MTDKVQTTRQYLFASDFDQTLSFNDSGYALSELIGIPPHEFERKAKGMAAINLVQQGGELTYLLLHDPEFRSRVRRHHLYETGKLIRLKPNIDLMCRILRDGIDGYRFEVYVISAAPVEIVRSALEGIVPADHIVGTEFEYLHSGEIDTIRRVVAGYGKVAVLDRLHAELQISREHIVYVGDGSSDIHVMLHVNHHDGFTIAVSENHHLAPIAKRTVLSDSAVAVVVPILEEIVGLSRAGIRRVFDANGFQIQDWDKVQTDRLVIRDVVPDAFSSGAASAAAI
jgi:HAD superfamily phosphoserine phosphatase-like hydrolase